MELYVNLDGFDLIKSGNAGLVYVQRQVSRGGKTFTQGFWTKPSDVKSTDVVSGGNPVVDLSTKPDPSVKNHMMGFASKNPISKEEEEKIRAVETAYHETSSQLQMDFNKIMSSLSQENTDELTKLYAEYSENIKALETKYTKGSDEFKVQSNKLEERHKATLKDNDEKFQVAMYKEKEQHDKRMAKNTAKYKDTLTPKPPKPDAKLTVKPDDKPIAPSFDKAKFESLKSNKPEAMKYLKDSGFIWKENPHEGVNWMRAMMSVKNGSKVDSKIDTSTPVTPSVDAKTPNKPLKYTEEQAPSPNIDKTCFVDGEKVGRYWKAKDMAGRMSWYAKSMYDTDRQHFSSMKDAKSYIAEAVEKYTKS